MGADALVDPFDLREVIGEVVEVQPPLHDFLCVEEFCFFGFEELPPFFVELSDLLFVGEEGAEFEVLVFFVVEETGEVVHDELLLGDEFGAPLAESDDELFVGSDEWSVGFEVEFAEDGRGGLPGFFVECGDFVDEVAGGVLGL